MEFNIGFEKEDEKILHRCWDEIIETKKLSEGKFTSLFKEKWSVYNDLSFISFSILGGVALAALEF